MYIPLFETLVEVTTCSNLLVKQSFCVGKARTTKVNTVLSLSLSLLKVKTVRFE